MKVKSEKWISFKKSFLEFVKLFENEIGHIDIPEAEEEFQLSVKGIKVDPLFTDKPEMFRIEYNFSKCDIKIRTLSFSTYRDCARIEMTIKKDA